MRYFGSEPTEKIVIASQEVAQGHAAAAGSAQPFGAKACQLRADVGADCYVPPGFGPSGPMPVHHPVAVAMRGLPPRTRFCVDFFSFHASNH